ncbi:MAG: hypothetical protein AMXMBFR57_31830 [Acidimicrobiia bacterium]
MTPVSRRGIPTDLRAWKKSQDLSREFLSGVSLHVHTHYSCESLAHLPRYVVQIPVVGTLFGREVEAHQRRSGSRVDFSKGWWHPPVSPRAVYDSEADHVLEWRDRRAGAPTSMAWPPVTVSEAVGQAE